MVELTCVVDINCLRRLCRAYKQIVKRWLRRKKPLPSREENNSNPERQNQIQQEVDKDNKAGGTTNGIHCFRFNDDDLKGNDPMSSRRRGSHRHRSRSSDSSCFPSIASLSRNEGGKNSTRRKSKGNYESIPNPSWNGSRSFKMPPHMNSRNASRRSSTPIMFSNSSGMLKPLPIEKTLECTLEELCYGCKKKIKITRDVITDTGEIVQEDELLTINVQPGWKTGTKITFEGKGNDRPGLCREDIIFFISEKSHQLFRREGGELELGVEIPLLKALTGGTISVPLLGGEEMNLTLDDIIYPGYEKVIAGNGMPISKEPGKRGNLRITFLVEFPIELADQQRSEVVSILQGSF